jgi:hypothetical protein
MKEAIYDLSEPVDILLLSMKDIYLFTCFYQVNLILYGWVKT